ncbi:hypothetical protein J6590_083472 [Homalodisca vitripennis]|nr:hypothetical protein J6590_083472 [Homalodisca vitripennis]
MERVILDDSSDIDRELGGDSDLSSLFSSDGQSKYNSSDYSNEDTDSDYNHRPNDVNNPDDPNVQLSNPEGDIYFAVGLNPESLDNPDVEFDRPNDENNDVANDPNVQFIVDSIHNKYEETQGQWKIHLIYPRFTILLAKNNVALAEGLMEKQTSMCGTLQQNREGNPL